jgi:hypothetical protein
VWSKGKRSRNKASVGEPADGSLRCFLNKKKKKKNYYFFLIIAQVLFLFYIKNKCIIF